MKKGDSQLRAEDWAELNARVNLTTALLSHSESDREQFFDEAQRLNARLEERNAELVTRKAELDQRKAELGALNVELKRLSHELSNLQAETERLKGVLQSQAVEIGNVHGELIRSQTEVGRLSEMNAAIVSSTSWKITAPLRHLLNLIRTNQK